MKSGQVTAVAIACLIDGSPEPSSKNGFPLCSGAIVFPDLSHYIRTLEPIPVEVMLQAFNAASETDRRLRYRQAASEIIPEAGKYLHSIHLQSFITAQNTDAEVRESIAQRKAYIIRASNLMPSLLKLLTIDEQIVVRSVVQRVDEFCLDYQGTKVAPHPKRARREIRDGLTRIIRSLKDVSASLDRFGHHLSIEFDHHLNAIADKDETEGRAQSFDEFCRDVKRLALAAEIVLYSDDVGYSELIVTDNKVKTRAVECIYEISIWQNVLPLVTTPGSDFSLACGILYEIASGERDASLAGAINKFTRSAERKRLDKEEQALQWDNSDEGMRHREADNFAGVRGRTTALEIERRFWDGVIRSQNWDDFHLSELLARRESFNRQLERAFLENGPYLVWADQISHSEFEQNSIDMQKIEESFLDMYIALGQARRKSRSD